MNEEKEKKKTGKKALLVLIPCLLAAAAAVVGIFLFRKPKTESEPSGEEEKTYEGAVYWNVDGEQFFHDNVSNRKKEDDGYYHATFLTENRQVSLRFADRALLTKADSKQAMGLVFDDKHTVVDVLDVGDFLGGIPYYNVYVENFEERKVTANFSASGKGLCVDFEIPENAPIYNVGGYYAGTYGEITNILYPTDQLVVLANKDDSIHSVYVVHREAGVDSNHRHCDCTEGTRAVAVSNGHVCEEHRYVPWNREDALPTETGYYYLNTDVMVAQASIKENQDVHLCLNGHTIHSVIDRRIYALFSEGCSLTITDCAEKPGSLLAHGSTDQGAVIWLRFGELTLFTGTYDASDIHTRNHPGACISLENNTHVTMYGGTLIGGHVPKGANGGTVYVKNKASFDMFGGVMTDGFAESSAGGNLFVDNEAVFTAYSGAVIRNGNAQTGGNIASHLKGVVNLNGATVENGVATAVKDPGTGNYSGGHGGNIAMAGTLNMNGGIIRNGKAGANGNGGGNLSVYTDNGKANLASGTIQGGVAPAGGGGNILTFYKQTGAGPQVVLNNMTITDGKTDGNGGNLCATAGMVALNGGAMKNGSAKIGGNIAISGDAAVTQNGGEVTGGTVTVTGGNVNIAKGSFTLSGGYIVNGTADNGNGGNILVGPDSKLFVSNGTISGGKGCIGGNIYILAGGTAEVKGGTVKDGYAYLKKEDDGKGGTKSSGGHGGNIACSGTLNILGGEILNGSIEEGGAGGGNISFVGKAAKLLMTGGKVSGGQSTESGGNMKAWHENPVLTITGGEISNGKCPNFGGNIWVGDDTVLTIDGVKITNGTANRGGNVYLSGRSKGLMTGGEVLGGNSTENGGNIYVALGTQFTLKNGTISGGNAAGDAGNIRVAGKMVMEGGLIADGISKGKTDIYGANLQMLGQSNTQETSFTMTGGEIKGWTYVRRLASKEDAVILTVSGNAKITGTGYYYESDVRNVNVQIGALTDEAYIVVKPNANTNFATGKDGFTAAMVARIGLTDSGKKVTATPSGSDFILSFANK